MPDFCTCGAQLPPDALFCHKCGKPQRDVIEPEPEIETVEFVRPVAPPEPPPPAVAQINFHDRVAVRVALVVAPVAFLMLMLPPVNLILWISAGFLAVLFHRRAGDSLNVRAGVRLGWITGVLMFAVTTVMFTFMAVPVAANGGILALFRQAASANPSDPRIQEALKMLENAPAANNAAVTMFALLILLFIFFVFITLLSMAGGALGAKFVSRGESAR